MSDRSAIEWTEATWKPTTGCDRVSPGCDNCYALTLAKRLKAMGSPKYQADGDPRTSGPGFDLSLHPDALTVPYGWKSPRTVFVNSMSRGRCCSAGQVRTRGRAQARGQLERLEFVAAAQRLDRYVDRVG